jgi:hypothetical protein
MWLEGKEMDVREPPFKGWDSLYIANLLYETGDTRDICWQDEDAGTCRTENEKFVRTWGGHLMRQTCRQSGGVPARLQHPLRNTKISS